MTDDLLQSESSATDEVLEEYPFTDVFLEQVSAPWQEECIDSLYPWEATPALRGQWRKLAVSSRDDEREAGIVGLARVANLSLEEQSLISSYIETHLDFRSCPAGMAIDWMLSGASPYPSIMPAFWGTAGYKDLCYDRFMSEMTSLWSRHPYCAMNLEILSQMMHAERNMQWGLNPCASPTLIAGLFKMRKRPWLPAVAAFNSDDESNEAIAEATSDLEILGYCLRPHLTSGQWNAIAETGFNGEFSFALLEHPVAMGRVCPVERNWGNPSRDLIEYASDAGSLGTVWRYWMPTLNYPWFREITDNIRELPQLLALTLVGKPYHLLLTQAREEGNGFMERLCLEHPTHYMYEYELEKEKRVEELKREEQKK